MAQDEDNISMVTNDDIKDSQRKSGGNPVSDIAKEQAKDKLLDIIAKSKLGTAIKGVYSKITAAIVPYLIPIIIIIVVVVCYIGIIAFFINMPGLVRGKLNQIITEAIKDIGIFLYGENSQLSGENINKEKRIELLQYLTDMGIDVVGYGFAPGVVYGDSENENKITDYDTNLMDYGKNESDAKNPNGDLVYYYLMANERAYIRKDNGILGKLFGTKRQWQGMIDIYGDEGFNGIEASVDRENLVLNMSVNNAHLGELLNEDQYSFPLEGWTGRYGIPVEFSLALHLATMSSGMVQELITNEDLQTTVTIGLQQPTKCKIDFKFRIKNEDGSIKEINIPYNAPTGNIEDLAKKIERGENITQDDLSIQGLNYAYTELALYDYNVITKETVNDAGNNYTVDEDKYVLDRVSRHLETIGAILDDKDIAVQTSKSGEEWETCKQSNDVPIYFYKNNSSSSYSLNSGVFVCQYTEDGKPDESTGKLKGSKSSESGIYRINYTKQSDKETNDYYVYRINVIENSTGNIVNNNIENTDYEEIVPKNNEASYDIRDGGKITTKRIKGLGEIKSIGRENFSMADYMSLKNDGYNKMFTEIDWFISYAKWINGDNWNNLNLNYNRTSEDINKFYNSEYDIDFSKISYYCKLYNDALSLEGNRNLQNVYDDLFKTNGLYEQLQADYKTIQENSISTKDSKTELANILKNSGYEGLSYEGIKYLHDQFATSADVNNKDVKYSQPYIMSVIKHWYKDIDFTKAYSNSSNSIELGYTGNSNLASNVEVSTILTPIEGETLKSQNGKQPYVIKGDVVLCDGEIQEDAELNNIYNVSNDSNGYNWGDGYRATKKIFTQGYYYTYDGTPETAKSIYFQQEMENTEGNTLFCFSVANSRITTLRIVEGDRTAVVNGTDGLKKSEIIDSFGNFKEDFTSKVGETVYNDNGITVYFTKENPRHNDISTTVKWYVMYVKSNGLEYLSPTNHEQSDVKSRVQTINDVWDSVGVICRRNHLSFDNTSADGQVMSITGLSILKNTQTEDAEYIYRDLKEMLIELGYYTEAEFDYLDTDVLTWFIPEYKPITWPQNSGEEALDFAAILYPKEEESENEESEEKELTEEEQLQQNLGLTVDKTQGFDPDLDVIAPGDCIIVNKTDEGIEIEFDGVSQPEIGVLDGYTMVIKGINTDSGITIIDEDGNETQISYEEAKKNKTVIKVGSIIGKTGTEEIKVLLMNDQGGILSNVEDYMDCDTDSYSGDIVMLDVDTEKIVEMIWQFEGVSDDDPNDGDYYTVCNPKGDSPTIGHGITPATIATWEELGYHGYVANGKFLQTKIPKEIVDNVSKMEIQKTLNHLNQLLDGYGVKWGGNQKAAWISLYYNGWHSTLDSMVEDWANGNYENVRNKWLVTCVSKDPTYTKGHQNRRAQEWVFFNTGELLSQSKAYDLCYVSKKY